VPGGTHCINPFETTSVAHPAESRLHACADPKLPSPKARVIRADDVPPPQPLAKPDRSRPPAARQSWESPLLHRKCRLRGVSGLADWFQQKRDSRNSDHQVGESLPGVAVSWITSRFAKTEGTSVFIKQVAVEGGIGPDTQGLFCRRSIARPGNQSRIVVRYCPTARRKSSFHKTQSETA
jgi:hypothetical protein